jgi:hypothetical protein
MKGDIGYWWESHKGKRLLGRPRCTWVANIKINLRETGWGGMVWIDLAQSSDQWRVLLNQEMNLQAP